MQPTALARFLLVRLPHENQEVSSVSYSNLPMACTEWKKKKSNQQLEQSHFLSRHKVENCKQNQVKIMNLYNTCNINSKNYDLEEKTVIPPLNRDGTFPSRELLY